MPPHGHPGMRKLPPPPHGRAPPPPRGRGMPPHGHGPPPGHPAHRGPTTAGRIMDEREFMNQKFRPGYDPRDPRQLPPPSHDVTRDVFGGRGVRPDKFREFGVPAPSEDSTVVTGPEYGHAPQPHTNHLHPSARMGEPRDVFAGGPRPSAQQQRERDVFGGPAPSAQQSTQPGPPMMYDSPQRMQKTPPRAHKSPSRPSSQYNSPHRMQKSPQSSHKSPSRPAMESFNQDDIMDGGAVANIQEFVSPRKVQPKDSHDGYDSPERKNTDSRHHAERKNTDSRHHAYHDPDEQPPRRKSLSERILQYKRKNTEELEFELASNRSEARHTDEVRSTGGSVAPPSEDTSTQPYMPPSGRPPLSKNERTNERLNDDHRTKTISKSADRPDNGEDDLGHNERMKRKQSLHERVAEFKERRKNSQGFGLGGMSDRGDVPSRRSLSKKSSHRGYGFESPDGRPTDGPRPSRRAKKHSNSDRKSTEHRHYSFREEDHVKKEKKKRRKSKSGKSRKHYSEKSPDPDVKRKISDYQKRRSFVGKPKKSMSELTPERVEQAVRRISHRSAPRNDRENDPTSKFASSARPKRRMSRRNDRDTHEWAVHE